MLPATQLPIRSSLCCPAGLPRAQKRPYRAAFEHLCPEVVTCALRYAAGPTPSCCLLRLQVAAEGAQVRDIQLPWANGQIEAARRAFLDKHPNNKHKDQSQLAKGDSERALPDLDEVCPTRNRGSVFKLIGLGRRLLCATLQWRQIVIRQASLTS